MVECDFQERVLVLVQLQGGNDGINTLVPIDQYDLYANLRPDIKIASKDWGLKKKELKTDFSTFFNGCEKDNDFKTRTIF